MSNENTNTETSGSEPSDEGKSLHVEGDSGCVAFSLMLLIFSVPVCCCIAGAFIDGIFGTSIIENLREAFKPLNQ